MENFWRNCMRCGLPLDEREPMFGSDDGCGHPEPVDCVRKLQSQLAAAVAAKEQAERERDEAREKYRLVCAHCGWECPLGGDMPAHIESCEKHPMRALKADRDRLAAEVAALREALEGLQWPNVPSADDLALLIRMCGGGVEASNNAMGLVARLRAAQDKARAVLSPPAPEEKAQSHT